MFKTSLIVTPFPPLRPGRSVTGIFRRLRMFASSLHKTSGHVRVLGLVPEAEIANAPDRRVLSEALAREWGFPMEVALFPSRIREKTTWNQYFPGMLSIGEQPGFYHYGGAEQIQAVREELERKPDMLFVHRLSAMIPILQCGIKPPCVLFDLDDVEHTVKLREAALRSFSAGKVASMAHLPAILRAERQGIAWAQKTFVCSEQDRLHLARFADGEKITTIPNAVDMPPPSFGVHDSPSILFLGDLKHGPNREGVERLIGRIWPLIRAKRPDARLIVAGPGSEALPVLAQGQGGIEFAGFVEDLPALYHRTRIVVCPLVTGGGTRIKLIEAASFGKPMVSTQIGAENLGLRDGQEIMIRDTDEGLAEACLQLLSDANACEKLSRAAYAKVSAVYSRPRVEQQILGHFENAWGESLAGGRLVRQ